MLAYVCVLFCTCVFILHVSSTQALAAHQALLSSSPVDAVGCHNVLFHASNSLGLCVPKGQCGLYTHASSCPIEPECFSSSLYSFLPCYT